MAYVLAVMAAFANALTSILQRMGVESAPAETNLQLEPHRLRHAPEGVDRRLPGA